MKTITNRKKNIKTSNGKTIETSNSRKGRKEPKMSVKDYYGNDVNFEAAVELMDKDICEQLHDQMAPCTEQEFFDAYAKAHAEKFDGEEFAPYYNLAW